MSHPCEMIMLYTNVTTDSYGWLINASMWHIDVITWKRFPHHRPFVKKINQLSVDSPHKGSACGALHSIFFVVRQHKHVNKQSMTLIWRHHHEIGIILLSRTDDIRKYKVISYGRLSNSSVWYDNSISISYEGLTNLSVWHRNSSYPIQTTYNFIRMT